MNLSRHLFYPVAALGFALTVAAAPHLGLAQSVTPVPALDLPKFTGTWYEIARLPSKAEKKCVGDVLILVGLEDKPNHFSVVTTCSLKDDTPQVSNESGKRKTKAADGKLEVTYLVFLHHQRWVLALDPAYNWALVGSPNHKDLWLYSRTVTLDPAVLADLRARAAAQGFNVAKLVMTPQTNHMRPKEVVKPNGAVSTGAVP